MTLVFASADELLRELRRYIGNPVGVEHEYVQAHGAVGPDMETIALNVDHRVDVPAGYRPLGATL